MTQHRTPTPDPQNPHTHLNMPTTPQQLSQEKVESTDGENVRYFPLFVVLLIVIFFLIFRDNTAFISLMSLLLALFGISGFTPIATRLLDYGEAFLKMLGKPLRGLLRIFFSDHPKRLAAWIKMHRVRLTNGSISFILIISLLLTTLRPFTSAILGSMNDFFCIQHTTPWPDCASGFGITTLSGGVRIGIIHDASDGPFDQTAFNTQEKQVEALIFRANQQACNGTHFTLAIVTMLSRTVETPASDAALGLEDLRGSALVQQDYNASHPAISLCLVIANIGTLETTDKAISMIVPQLARLARTDSSFHGIVGFPFSHGTKAALNQLKAYPSLAAIPIISPSASADTLSNYPNFYRIASPDKSQGKVLAKFFCDYLFKNNPPQSIAVLDDNQDDYSNSLQTSFEEKLECPAKKIDLSYTTANEGSIRQAIDEAVAQQANYIFFPGYNSDLDTLETELRNKMRNNSASVTIIGGDGLYDISSVVHYNYTNVYSTIFASPLSADSPFIQEYKQQGFPLPYLINALSNYNLLPSHAILSYDAATAFTETLKNFHAEDMQENDFQQHFNSLLAKARFIGISGSIQFQGERGNGYSSDRLEGSVYITCTDLSHNIHLNARYTTTNSVGFVQEDTAAIDSPQFCL